MSSILELQELSVDEFEADGELALASSLSAHCTALAE